MGAPQSSDTRILKFEAQAGVPADVIGVFFSGPTPHASMSAAWGQFEDKGAPLVDGTIAGRLIDVAIPLNWGEGSWPQTDDGLQKIRESLDDVVAGVHDSDFTVMFKRLRDAGYGDSYLRIGHEMADPNWGGWAAVKGETEKHYIAAFRHVVVLARSISPTFRINWCGMRYTWQQGYDPIAWPGSAYVDVVGLDIYWRSNNPPVITDPSFISAYADVLETHRAFAASHGKPVAYPEWGQCGHDDPAFVDFMYDWFEPLGAQLEYQIYFGPGKLENGWQHDIESYPKVYDRLAKRFGAKP